MGRRRFVLLAVVVSLLAAVPVHADSQSLAGRKLALDAGHGGTDAGGSGSGLVEKDVTLDVARRARDLLALEGATVVMTRDCDCSVDLAARVAAANDAAVDRFLSIHANNCGGCGGKGTETYYHSSLAATSTSAKLATLVQEEMVAKLGTADRGLKQADFYVLRETSMPAVLVEMGFLDSPADAARLGSPEGRQDAARALLHAVQRHYGIAPHDPAPPPPPPPATFQVGITSPSTTGWLRGTVTAQGASNQEANLNWMRFLVDGSVAKWVTAAPHAWTWDTRAFPDGARELRLEAENLTGKRAAAALEVRLDNTAPVTDATLGGTPGDNGWWRSAVDLALAASDAASGVASTMLSLDGSPFAPAAPARLSGDGAHAAAFFSTDVAGNVEATHALDILIDTTPPTVALQSPAEGRAYVLGQELPGPALPFTLVAGDMVVQADASDATSGVARLELRVDGALRGVATATPWALAWDAGSEALGEHDVRVVAFDLAGNSAEDGLKVTTVPTTPAGLLATLGVGA